MVAPEIGISKRIEFAATYPSIFIRFGKHNEGICVIHSANECHAGRSAGPLTRIITIEFRTYDCRFNDPIWVWIWIIQAAILFDIISVVCYLAFDIRMESFSDKERQPNSKSNKLIQAAEDSNSCLLPLDQGLPIWRRIETPVYRKFRLSQEYLERYDRQSNNRIRSKINV